MKNSSSNVCLALILTLTAACRSSDSATAYVTQTPYQCALTDQFPVYVALKVRGQCRTEGGPKSAASFDRTLTRCLASEENVKLSDVSSIFLTRQSQSETDECQVKSSTYSYRFNMESGLVQKSVLSTGELVEESTLQCEAGEDYESHYSKLNCDDVNIDFRYLGYEPNQPAAASCITDTLCVDFFGYSEEEVKSMGIYSKDDCSLENPLIRAGGCSSRMNLAGSCRYQTSDDKLIFSRLSTDENEAAGCKAIGDQLGIDHQIP